MSQYIDAHCHVLDTLQMRNAMARGVGRFIMNATRPSDWNAVIKISMDDGVLGAIGVHPWYVADLPLGWDDDLIKLLADNSHLMVGEIGLDKNRPDMEKQISVFARQLQIAHNLGRVAHIHVVGAWGKIMGILRENKLPPAMVFHAFSGSVEIMHELTKMGAYFSFGWGVVDARHENMRALVASVPENRILVESDAPDGTMPDKIPDIVAEIAKVRGAKVDFMAEKIFENTMGLINDRPV